MDEFGWEPEDDFATQEAVSQEKISDCHRAGNAVLELIRRDIKPLDIMSRKAFENAISVVIALGGYRVLERDDA